MYNHLNMQNERTDREEEGKLPRAAYARSSFFAKATDGQLRQSSPACAVCVASMVILSQAIAVPILDNSLIKKRMARWLRVKYFYNGQPVALGQHSCMFFFKTPLLQMQQCCRLYCLLVQTHIQAPDGPNQCDVFHKRVEFCKRRPSCKGRRHLCT